MKNKQSVLSKIINILNWLLFLPVAFGLQAIFIVLLSSLFVLVGLNSQLFLDSVSAFLGTFLIILLSSYFAPSNKIKVGEVLCWIFLSLSIIGTLLIVFNIYSLVNMEKPNIIVPILQMTGTIYAGTFFPYLILKKYSYDTFLGKIAGLGGGTTFLGGLIIFIGFILKLFTNRWETFDAGKVVISLGIITWAYPWIILYISTKKAIKEINTKYSK